ncbi:hypothetical protein D915_008389 [Fasciola hepatica]|uniref:Uncharacterized protein n=1 Tax=Fasciola hepatica TaxID=6192 RepID=A0A4E0R5D4_FASHE|nr:hypothetical protein D915_008389 [Fasciola hepatica]
MVSEPSDTNPTLQSEDSTDGEEEEGDVMTEEFLHLNAQLDALLNYMNVLEAQGDRICNAARELVNDCQEQSGRAKTNGTVKQA